MTLIRLRRVGGKEKPLAELEGLVDIAFHLRDKAPKILDVPSDVGDNLKSILWNCWAYEPASRPEMDKIVESILGLGGKRRDHRDEVLVLYNAAFERYKRPTLGHNALNFVNWRAPILCFPLNSNLRVWKAGVSEIVTTITARGTDTVGE